MHALDTPKMESEPLGLKVFKMKAMIQESVAHFDGNKYLPPLFTVQGEHFCFADSFVYLWRGIGIGRRDEFTQPQCLEVSILVQMN